MHLLVGLGLRMYCWEDREEKQAWHPGDLNPRSLCYKAYALPLCYSHWLPLLAVTLDKMMEHDSSIIKVLEWLTLFGFAPYEWDYIIHFLLPLFNTKNLPCFLASTEKLKRGILTRDKFFQFTFTDSRLFLVSLIDSYSVRFFGKM